MNNNGEDKELVYLFLYNPMVHTNGWTTQSVHKKRYKAIEAMEAHIAEAKLKWEEDFPSDDEKKHHPFGKFEDWRVNAMILLP